MRSWAAPLSPASGPRRSIAAVGTALSIGATVLLGLGLPADQAGAAAASTAAAAPPSVVVGGRPSPGGLDLVVVGGVDAVHISAAPLGADLLRATAPAVGGGPAATRTGSRIVVSNAAVQPTTPPGVLDIVVARGVQWSITLNGGASEATVDMHDGSLSALTFADGVADVSAQLPAATGLERVTLAGGAHALTVTAPAGSPAQVVAAAGASKINLDGSTYPGVSGGSVFTERGWAGARHRYAIDLTSGVSDFVFTRTGRRA